MKKNLFKIIIIIVAIILVISIIPLKYFVIGKIQDVKTFAINNLSVTSDKIFFNFRILTSADVIRNYSYRIENHVIYIKFTSVIVGILGSFQKVEIEGDFSTLQKIILEDKENERVIWERDTDF